MRFESWYEKRVTNNPKVVVEVTKRDQLPVSLVFPDAGLTYDMTPETTRDLADELYDAANRAEGRK